MPVCRFALETVIEALALVLVVRLPLPGLTVSHFAPSVVEVDADHAAAGPQLPTVTIWAPGFDCPCVALNASDVGVTLIQDGLCGDDCILRMTLTTAKPDPILNVTLPVYMPCPSRELETETVTVEEAFPFNLPLAGFTLSQFAPLSVWDVADQEPAEPQLVSVTNWEPGLAWPWVAVKVSDCVLEFKHAVAFAERTMNVTLRETLRLF